jgi:ABC-type transport system substrate-binding protein
VRRLIALVRLVVALLMVIAGLLGAGKHPVPAPAPASPATSAGAPSPTLSAPVAPAPTGVVPTGPTPHCTYSMIVNRATNSERWIVVCIVYGQSTTLPGDWATAKDARAATFAFQQAWRDAVKNGTPL